MDASSLAPAPLSTPSSSAPVGLQPLHSALAGLPPRVPIQSQGCPAPTRGAPGGRRPGPRPCRPGPPAPAAGSHGWTCTQPAELELMTAPLRAGRGLGPGPARTPPTRAAPPQTPPPTRWGSTALLLHPPSRKESRPQRRSPPLDPPPSAEGPPPRLPVPACLEEGSQLERSYLSLSSLPDDASAFPF